MTTWRCLRTILVMCAFAAGAIAAACGGDDGESETAAPSGPADLSPRVGGIEALRTYLLTTGLEGDKGTLTEPIDCDAASNEGAEGDYCIKSDEKASIYAPGLVIVFVADTGSPDSEIWQAHIERTDGGWEVTEVERVPAE